MKNQPSAAPHMELDIKLDLGLTGDGKISEPEPVNIKELAEIGLFHGADVAALEKPLSSCVMLTLVPGQKLVSIGQLNPKVFFLIDGQLKLYTEASVNKPIGIVDVGQSAGLISAIKELPSTESIVASEQSRVLVMGIDTLKLLIMQSHPLASRFALMLMQCARGEHYVPTDGSAAGKGGHIGYVDELTGLHNQRWIEKMLSRLIMRHSKEDKPLSVIMCDIDKFKDFNKDFGEMLENQALSTVAQIMLANVRPTDMIARFDLDVFLLLLPDTDISGAKMLAIRLQEVVSKTDIVIPSECVLPPVTMSFGVAQLKGFVSDEVFISDVKVALDGAKKSGGNWVKAIE